MKNMPTAYFNNVHYAARLRHVRAIAAQHETGVPLADVQVRGENEVTVIVGPGSKKKTLYDVLSETPNVRELSCLFNFSPE
jgi:hypothetical protein